MNNRGVLEGLLDSPDCWMDGPNLILQLMRLNLKVFLNVKYHLTV